ncbi:VOC family protein [Yoonia sp. BS5-3]|uniref:VOC family protein n=1 Tax=Yoonia phaeophyticola TaxID=3137369 RepID=A0ABZ2UZD4_9RHOB
MAYLEHANITVADPRATAAMLSDVFGWTTRWEGAAINGGFTVHVGSARSYLALYAGPNGSAKQTTHDDSYARKGGLNHIGVVVDDLDAIEQRVSALGFEPHSHADYEPGRRFYFYDHDGVEIEVISYT